MREQNLVVYVRVRQECDLFSLYSKTMWERGVVLVERRCRMF